MMAFAKKASMPSSAPAQVRLLAFEFRTPASGRLTAAPKFRMLPMAPDLEPRLSCAPSKLSREKVLPPLSSMSGPCRSARSPPLDGSRSLLRTPACIFPKFLSRAAFCESQGARAVNQGLAPQGTSVRIPAFCRIPCCIYSGNGFPRGATLSSPASCLCWSARSSPSSELVSTSFMLRPLLPCQRLMPPARASA